MEDRRKIISKIYTDKSGYGSMKVTLEDARKIDKTIKLEHVKEYFKENVSEKKQLKGYNSFIAPYPKYEYQLDLMFFSDLKNQNFNVGLVLIDIFTKYACVVPIKTKDTGNVASGIMEGIVKMGGKPEIIYSDDEGALSTGPMKEYFEKENIKHIITRSHAWFVERFIRTFKDSLYKRIDDHKEAGAQWTSYVHEILLTYNNKLKHSATGYTPSEASKSKNELDVRLNLLAGKKHTRTYPHLSMGDNVKIYRKKPKNNLKERFSTWSDKIYKLEGMSHSHGQTYFKLEGVTREYLRYELLKV